jgi:hypothetical protein
VKNAKQFGKNFPIRPYILMYKEEPNSSEQEEEQTFLA